MIREPEAPARETPTLAGASGSRPFSPPPHCPAAPPQVPSRQDFFTSGAAPSHFGVTGSPRRAAKVLENPTHDDGARPGHRTTAGGGPPRRRPGPRPAAGTAPAETPPDGGAAARPPAGRPRGPVRRRPGVVGRGGGPPGRLRPRSAAVVLPLAAAD